MYFIAFESTNSNVLNMLMLIMKICNLKVTNLEINNANIKKVVSCTLHIEIRRE